MDADGYRPVIGEKNYSSWSTRAWMVLRFLELPFEVVEVNLYREGSREVVRGFGGETGLVPVLLHGGLAIWDTSGQAGGPWLFGEFGAADILFAPIATRFRTYDVELAGNADRYHRELLQHDLVAEWSVLGAAESGTIPVLELPPAPVPGLPDQGRA